MKNILFICFSFFFFFTVFSQNSIDYYSLIDSNRIKKHVSVLAHDSLEGRNTGELGQKLAASYISNEFLKSKLSNFNSNYLQEFKLIKKHKSGTLTFNGKILSFPSDFGFFSYFQPFNSSVKITETISLEELNTSNLNKNKSYIVNVNSIKNIDFEKLKSKQFDKLFFICENYEARNFKRFNEGSLTFISKRGEEKLFFINAQKIKTKIKNENSIELNINETNSYEIATENVVGYIEGSDSILKKEFVVVSAHYDHLGIINGKIYNGADDNASGTSTLLELARVFNLAKINGQNPKRSILFICFTGEEHGLLGSEYYSENPLVPLNKTVADFNIDMIGRAKYPKEKDKFSVFIIGSNKISKDFHEIHERVAEKHNKLNLDYTYNEDSNPEKLYYRSDHYNFAKNGIPSIFYFGGFHEDYHKTTDDIEKLNFTKIKTIGELVFLTIWEIAN